MALAALTIPNSPAGAERLLGWLDEHDARGAIVGIENAAGYRRLLCAALAAAGCEVLNVPAWRTHRDRHEQGRGKRPPRHRGSPSDRRNRVAPQRPLLLETHA